MKKKISIQLNFMIKNNFNASHTDYEIINSQNKSLPLRNFIFNIIEIELLSTRPND